MSNPTKIDMPGIDGEQKGGHQPYCRVEPLPSQQCHQKDGGNSHQGKGQTGAQFAEAEDAHKWGGNVSRNRWVIIVIRTWSRK